MMEIVRPFLRLGKAKEIISIFKRMTAQLPDQNNAYGLVYCTTNLVNGKKYIGKLAYGKYKDGKTVKDYRTNYLGSGPILWRAIEKHGESNFTRETLQFCIDKNDLNESEIYWIDYFGAQKSELFYNITAGGEGGNLGEEACKKIGEANSRRSKQDNWKGFKKGIGSKPYAYKISAAKTGKPALHRRKKCARFTLDGVMIESYEAMSLAKGFSYSKIVCCCRGSRKTHGGFIWRYL